jgi:vanillate O-demethylase monooxygenase subunit
VRWGVRTPEENLNRDLQKKVAEMRRFAFEEQDAPVIEAQQRVIEDATEPLDPVILAVDVGCVRYKRVLGKMRDAEQR